MIKAICFDFFGVICSDEYWALVGHDKQTESVFRDFTDEVNSGELAWKDFLQKVSKASGKSVDEISRMYQTEQIHPKLVAYITTLKPKFKTALITNAHEDFIEPLIERAHLTEIFDVITVSSTIGEIKPNPEIFRYTLQKLNVLPEESVMIDDLARHVEGARNVGMQAILYQDFQQMKTELDEILTNSKN